MFTDFNISLINDTMIDIYINTTLNENDENYNPNVFNLTWEVLSFVDNILKFQLEFENPLKISSVFPQDKIVVHLKQDARELFHSFELKEKVHPIFWTMAKPIRK